MQTRSQGSKKTGKPMPIKQDLNGAFVLDSDGIPFQLGKRPAGAASGNVEVVFRDHTKRLVEEIRKADYVLGAVAWLTHEEVIAAMSKLKMGCGVIVQKEDFLRPDSGAGKEEWARELRKRYGRLKNKIARFSLPAPACELSYCADPDFDPVRCMGNHNSDKNPAFPRMHNKFLVFCRVAGDEMEHELEPYAVWTGSFNVTANATCSAENAVILRDAELAQAYATEWAHLFVFSEPLDWTSEWMAPDYRLGS